jgi:type II secretory pathway pseudopilin PulG
MDPRSLNSPLALSARSPSRRRGFSYAEIAIVALILGIMAAAAVPKYADALVRMRLDAAARRIAADLATAQAQARAGSARQTIAFTVPPAGICYQIVGMKDPDRPASTYTVNLAEPPYQITLNSVDLGGDATLIYNGYGIPDSGGTIVIQAGQYTKRITIDPDTGIATALDIAIATAQ